MSEIVLFHSVLGIRPGVHDAVNRMRAAGHTVHAPDLYLGDATFDEYDEAIAYQDRIGYEELLARAAAAVADLPPELFFAGFSAGTAPAQLLAATRPGARGALILHGGLPQDMLGIAAWPAAVPVQVHFSEGDPFRSEAELAPFLASVRDSGAPLEFFEYPGSGHLFTDPSLPAEFDPASTELLWERALAFLA